MASQVFLWQTIAARRIGITRTEYVARREAGERWCSFGKHWEAKGRFYTTMFGNVERDCIPCRALRGKAQQAKRTQRARERRAQHGTATAATT